MAYTSGDTILATHYNGFVTSVNALWGTGTGNRGIGQSSTISSISAGNTVAATQWATLLDRIRSLSDHYGQDGSITVDSVTNPSATDTITALTTLATDIGTIDTAQTTVASVAAGYSTAITDTVAVSGNFTTTITQTSTFTFSSANEMRYFFNAGGKIECSWALSDGTSDDKYDNWVTLAAACGTYQIFNTTSGKSGGSGTATTNLTNSGFWDLTTSPTLVFKQFEDTSPYTTNYIQLSASLDAVPGSSTVLTLTTVWQDDAAEDGAPFPDLDIVDGTKTTTFSASPPATTYITNTWGTPAWANTVNTQS